MVSTDVIWTILCVLLVQLMLGVTFAVGYRMGRKSRLEMPVPAHLKGEETEDTEVHRKAQKDLQQALSTVMAYDVKTAMKRRVQNG